MNLSLGSRCVKYLMFIFNLLFVLTGTILLSIGVAIYGVYYQYQYFLDNKFLSAPSLLIAIGAIIFLIAFFGCCGAVRESYYMLITFTSLLVIVFILELSGGISGYVLRVRASAIVQDKMKDTMASYNNNTEIQFVWDKLQKDFNCCGTNNSSDWSNLKMKIPHSCYNKTNFDDPNNHTIFGEIYTNGCYDKFLSFIKSHALQIAGVGLGIAFIQAMGIWFSVYLARSIRNSYESV